MWNAQVEAGSSQTSDIVTEGSTVTRAAEVATVEGADFTGFFVQGPGTLFVESESPSYTDGQGRVLVGIGSSSFDNTRYSEKSSTYNFNSRVRPGAAASASLDFGTAHPGIARAPFPWADRALAPPRG